ncbi:hypothetical protein FDUTEX481_04054 [Tolypothrix sp. PCC 7601]|nr:hypothetical protein FDUTEX481_04054 [Tolypothrix sp. PCC 7601]
MLIKILCCNLSDLTGEKTRFYSHQLNDAINLSKSVSADCLAILKRL